MAENNKQEAHCAEIDINADNADAVRRRKIIFRAWHRGIREMDLLLGAYVDKNIRTMSAAELEKLEHIMHYEDSDLLHYFTGEAAVPADIDDKMFDGILSCRGYAD